MNENILNKKTLIIGGGVAVLVLILSVMIISSAPREDTKNAEDFGKLTNSGYYVENGIEDKAEIAKNATEAYLEQNTDETIDERDSRLSQYFTKSSSIYGQKISTNQTGEVTSVISCEVQESGWCLSVMANVSIDGNQDILRRYWVTLEEQTDGSFIAKDIGVWE